MSRRATTFRLDPEVQAALAALSDVQGRPQNQLVNEAVRELVAKRTRDVEVDLESTLTRLRAHRFQDADGERSMAVAMEAEAAVEHDPADGVRVERPLTSGPASLRMLEREWLTGTPTARRFFVTSKNWAASSQRMPPLGGRYPARRFGAGRRSSCAGFRRPRRGVPCRGRA